MYDSSDCNIRNQDCLRSAEVRGRIIPEEGEGLGVEDGQEEEKVQHGSRTCDIYICTCNMYYIL